ncbi:hypothetical protein O53_2442 [Microcystis aeruginosa TAIHU98]|uniref:Uncharacterized protein n=1 Tax=Microcystis aeruginosa TAIHU98 TaxID=1134457 RepID=L7E453_MICAE|nr:hypothetical protein O53_2442 [Microcystis aeruginosa TAIHU98]
MLNKSKNLVRLRLFQGENSHPTPYTPHPTPHTLPPPTNFFSRP